MYKIKKFEYTPVLGWSLSRYDLFQICKRRYYYTYYAKYDCEYPLEKTSFLKEMTSVPLAVGNVSHAVVETLLGRLLKEEGRIDREKFFEYTGRTLERYCKTNTFREAYYKEVSEIDASIIEEAVTLCLTNFLNSNRMKWLREKAITTKKDWILEPPGYGETRIDGLKAYFKVDFLFPVDERVYIIDWKTGQPFEEKYRKQLLGYTGWASYHLDITPGNIVPIIAYLKPEYEEKEYEFNEYDIQAFFTSIKQETKEMYDYCDDVDENIPKPKTYFVMTDNTEICRNCNFRELCGR
jgi:hypothetical protein